MKVPVLGYGPEGDVKLGEVEVADDLSFTGKLYDGTMWAEMLKMHGAKLMAFSLVVMVAKPE